jgi:hypothetical protein
MSATHQAPAIVELPPGCHPPVGYTLIRGPDARGYCTYQAAGHPGAHPSAYPSPYPSPSGQPAYGHQQQQPSKASGFMGQQHGTGTLLAVGAAGLAAGAATAAVAGRHGHHHGHRHQRHGGHGMRNALLGGAAGYATSSLVNKRKLW